MFLIVFVKAVGGVSESAPSVTDQIKTRNFCDHLPSEDGALKGATSLILEQKRWWGSDQWCRCSCSCDEDFIMRSWCHPALQILQQSASTEGRSLLLVSWLLSFPVPFRLLLLHAAIVKKMRTWTRHLIFSVFSRSFVLWPTALQGNIGSTMSRTLKVPHQNFTGSWGSLRFSVGWSPVKFQGSLGLYRDLRRKVL